MNEQEFIQGKFTEFYEKNSATIKGPSSIDKREFGFFLFKGGFMTRHKGFSKVEKLRTYIKQIAPAHVYYSTAYYEMPEEKMESKGWLGAELFFDIDADHIPTKCGKKHDTWSCKNCGFSGRGLTPNKCPKCSQKRYNEKIWICEDCLESAKQETIKLIDFLIGDFGFSPDKINIYFSGNRGYHINVEDDEIVKLNSLSRMEIVDYVMGIGLEPSFMGLTPGKNRILSGPKLEESGWRGRISRGIYDFFQNPTTKDLREIGLKKRTINEIIKKKDYLSKLWGKKGPWNLIKGLDNSNIWKTIIQKSAVMVGDKIDTVVSTDIHRLIRLENTLHGKTGFLKIPLQINEIEKFDPLKRALAFKKGEVKVFIEEAP
jgi:DNA primase small subunit